MNRKTGIPVVLVAAMAVVALTPTAMAAGITHYSVSTGAFSSTFNPTLSGGEFDGLAYSEFASTDFVGIRDGVGFEVALVPEPGMLALLAIGGLTMLRRRRSG